MPDATNIAITEEVRERAAEVLEEELDSNEIEIWYEKGTNKGDNYNGIVYTATGKLKVQTDENGNARDATALKLVVKVAPQSALRREQFHIRACFMREIKMYTEVLTMFRDFQEACGVAPEANGFFEFPGFCRAIDSELSEALIFKDLREEGFVMYDRLKAPTFEHVRLVMNAIGKFHGLSFALRVSEELRTGPDIAITNRNTSKQDQLPEKLEQCNDLPEIFMNDMNKCRSYVDNFSGIICGLLDDDAELKKKVEKLLYGNFVGEILDSVSPEAAGQYAVICHGDCWNNNILFRHNTVSAANPVPVDKIYFSPHFRTALRSSSAYSIFKYRGSPRQLQTLSTTCSAAQRKNSGINITTKL